MAGTEISGVRRLDQATAPIATRLENVTAKDALDTLRTVATKLNQNGKTLVLTGISDATKPLVFKRWNNASEERSKKTVEAIEILLDRAAQGVSEHRKRNLQSALKSYLDRSSNGPRDLRHLIDKGIGDLVTAIEHAQMQQEKAVVNAQNANPVASAAVVDGAPANPQPQAPARAAVAPQATQAPSAQHLAQALDGELMALRNSDPLEPTHPLRANRRELLGRLTRELSSNPGWISNRLGAIRDRLRLEA
jgi:hypothetical protein